MLGRTVLILTAVWSLVAMPTLCETSLLSHACTQHDSDSCGHESDCGDDPCAQFASAQPPSTSRIQSSGVLYFAAAILWGGCQVPLDPGGRGLIVFQREQGQDQRAPGVGLPLLI